MTPDPPQHRQQPTWKIIVVSLLALFFIFNKTDDILDEIAEGQTVNIEMKEEIEKAKTKVKNLAEQPLGPDDIFPALAKIKSAGHSDLHAYQRDLEKNRGELNARFIKDMALRRAGWINTTSKYIQSTVLGVLFLLLLPVFFWRSLPADPARNRRVFEALPFFLLTTAAALFLVDFLATAALAIQAIQLIIAGISSPPIAFTDGLVHYLTYQISTHDLQDLWNFFAFRQPSFEEDPVAAIGALHHLAEGIRQAHESDLLRLGFDVVKKCTWMVDLIGPAFALTTLLLIYGSVIPVLRQAVIYPRAVLSGEAEGRLWPFIKSQLLNGWRELRATTWVLFIMIGISLAAALAVRILVYPIVVVFIQSLLATEAHLRGGGELPDIGIFMTLCSLGIFLVIGMAALFGGAGVAIGKAYLMFRHRAHNRGAFRDYPDFKWVFRTALFKVSGLAIVLGGVIGVVYWALGLLQPPPILRLWSGPILFGPVYLGLLWWLRIPQNLLETKRRKVIHSPILASLVTRKATENG